MPNGWTDERRAKQAEAIRRWKPWERSTGPKTEEGKAASSRNAWKDSPKATFRAFLKRLGQLLKEQEKGFKEILDIQRPGR